jgi:hypothetical protein
MTRLEAIHWCQRQLEKQIFIPVSGTEPFQDGPFLYGLNPEKLSSLLRVTSKSGYVERKHDAEAEEVQSTLLSTLLHDKEQRQEGERAVKKSTPNRPPPPPPPLPQTTDPHSAVVPSYLYYLVRYHKKEGPRSASSSSSLSSRRSGEGGGGGGSGCETTTSTTTTSSSSSTVNTTRTVRLEMDKTKTDRYEWVNLVYNTIFEPLMCYEMQLQWMVCTGGVVADFVMALMRKARQCNFTLVQIPTNHKVLNALQVPCHRPLRILTGGRGGDGGGGGGGGGDGPTLNFEQSAYVTHILMTTLDFVPRTTAPHEFVHLSGTLFVDLTDTGFQWTINWMSGVNLVQAHTLVHKFLALADLIDVTLLSDMLPPATVWLLLPTSSTGPSTMGLSSSVPQSYSLPSASATATTATSSSSLISMSVIEQVLNNDATRATSSNTTTNSIPKSSSSSSTTTTTTTTTTNTITSTTSTSLLK